MVDHLNRAARGNACVLALRPDRACAAWLLAVVVLAAGCGADGPATAGECDGAEGVSCDEAPVLDDSEMVVGSANSTTPHRVQQQYRAAFGDEPARQFESAYAELGWSAIPRGNAVVESVTVSGVVEHPYATSVGVWLATRTDAQSIDGRPDETVVRELRDTTHYGARGSRYAFRFTTSRFNGMQGDNAWYLHVVGPEDVYLRDCWTATSGVTESYQSLQARRGVFTSNLEALGYSRSAFWQERHCDEYTSPMYLSDVQLTVTMRAYPTVVVEGASIPPIASNLGEPQAVQFEVPRADFGPDPVVRVDFELSSGPRGDLYVNLFSPRNTYRRVFGSDAPYDLRFENPNPTDRSLTMYSGQFDGRLLYGETAPVRWAPYAREEIAGRWTMTFEWLNAAGPLTVRRMRLVVNPPSVDTQVALPWTMTAEAPSANR